MRRFAPLAAILLAAVAVPAVIAQPPASAPGAPDKTRVTAGTYAADPNHTMVVWKLDHLGFSNYTGIFGDVTGTLVLDPANPAAAKVDVTIPVAKVTTASAGLTAHLLRAGKDEAKKYMPKHMKLDVELVTPENAKDFYFPDSIY